MPYEQILVERRAPAAILTLNRPEKLHAWSGTMAGEPRQAITAANDDGDVPAIVLTGAGRAFCAGADVSGWQRDLQHGDAPTARTDNPVTAQGDSWVHLMQRSKPVIAAINGVAVGVGATQVLSADSRIAAEGARFGFTFAKMGVVPELASTYLLAQLVGLGAALEMCLTARMVGADEALRLGLVSRVVSGERLVDEAVALAETIAGPPPLQLRLTKQLFARNAAETDIDAVMAREGEALRQAFASPEFHEAVSAFLQKRPANFRTAASAR